jgi:rubrerythrin
MNLSRTALPHWLRCAAGVLIATAWLTVSVNAQVAARHPGAPATVAMLNDAWNLENHELQRSVAFAQKAEQESYTPVASLFRASAAAELVHLRNLTLAMKKLGYAPDAAAEPFAVGSTGENLQLEIAAHVNYRDKVLPGLLGSARREGFRSALRSLSDAGRTEESLVKYYTRASEELESSKGKLRQTYYVCSKCGYMTTNLNFHVCKVCYHFRERHEAVS